RGRRRGPRRRRRGVRRRAGLGRRGRHPQRLGGGAAADRASLGGAAARCHRPGGGVPAVGWVHQPAGPGRDRAAGGRGGQGAARHGDGGGKTHAMTAPINWRKGGYPFWSLVGPPGARGGAPPDASPAAARRRPHEPSLAGATGSWPAKARRSLTRGPGLRTPAGRLAQEAVRYQDGPTRHAGGCRKRRQPVPVILASQATAVPFTVASNGPDRTPWTTPARPRPASFIAFADDDPARPGFGSRWSAHGVT